MGLKLGTKMRLERKKNITISTASKILSPNTNLKHITHQNEHELLFNKSVQNALLGMPLNNPTPTHLKVHRYAHMRLGSQILTTC